MSQTYVLTQNITRSLDWLGHVTQMDCQHTAQPTALQGPGFRRGPDGAGQTGEACNLKKDWYSLMHRQWPLTNNSGIKVRPYVVTWTQLN